MKTKGSKSVPSAKPLKAIPKEAKAPAADKGGRRAKPTPTVSTPKNAVPEWAERAAARDTAAEMAALPEPASVANAAGETAAPTKGRTPKALKAKPAAGSTTPAAAAPGSLCAIGDGWLSSLRAAGHTPSTLSSYAADLAIAYEHLGGDAVAAELTEKLVAGFNASELVTKKKSGKPKARPTILKTRRALRLALVWAETKKLIKKAPIPAA